MEVTKSNFKECLEEIESAIKNADFLSIDGEFTGLKSQHSEPIGTFDTPEERYHKLRKGAADFLLLQFGLTAFKYDTETKRHTARPFNMYVFQRPFSRQAPDRRFLCQSSSIDFLVSQGFDFNKVFRDGISYLTTAQEQYLKEAVEKKYAEHSSSFSSPSFMSPHGSSAGPNKGPVEVPDNQKEFIEDVSEKIKSFLAEPEGESLQLPACSAFQRKLIYQTARLKFSNVHLETKACDKERYIVVSFVRSEEELKAREQAQKDADLAEVDEAVGICKVMRMISQSGKLVVGHNMFLDLIHLINQFHFPLPEEYEDFKAMTKCIFPRLLDTKLLANTAPFKEHISDSTLGVLRKISEAKPFVKPNVDLPEGFSGYDGTSEFLHEAAYDAYITGLIFISLSNYLGSLINPPNDRISPSSPLVEPFINKLHLMRVFDIPYLNLAGPDLSPNRDHIFHVTIPKDWKKQDIFHLFSAFGNISISWINDTSSLVSLFKKENTAAALKALSKGDDPVKVVPYSVYKQQSSPPPASPPPPASRKRKHSSEDGGCEKHAKPSRVKQSVEQPDSAEVPKDVDDEEEDGEDTSESDSDSSDDSSNKKAKKMFDEPEVW